MGLVQLLSSEIWMSSGLFSFDFIFTIYFFVNWITQFLVNHFWSLQIVGSEMNWRQTVFPYPIILVPLQEIRFDGIRDSIAL